MEKYLHGKSVSYFERLALFLRLLPAAVQASHCMERRSDRFSEALKLGGSTSEVNLVLPYRRMRVAIWADV